MDSKSAVGQVVPYNPPAMQWINFFIDIITEEVELLMHPAGIILMVFIFCMIGKLFMSKAKFTREKDQQLTEIKKCNNIIATLRHENEIHKSLVKQLNEEMIGLKANTDRKLRQLKDDCKRKLAKRDRRIAVLKDKLEHTKTFWMVKLAEKEKDLASLMETRIQLNIRTEQMEVLYQEWKAVCGKLKGRETEVIKWKEKYADTEKQLSIVQESANILARAKVILEAKMAEMEANYKKALLKSRPRLIDLHYLIVQRLPPSPRGYASAFCFTLGLNMEFAGYADDKFQVTAAFRRWLECGSSIPRTWGALLVALRRDFRYDEIPATWVDDITKDLVYGGIAALPTPEHFCGNCCPDVYKEHDCYDIEDDSGGITEAKEESGIPPSKEMVVP